MKLSTKARYGLKACFTLALEPNKTHSLSEISTKTGVTPAYLDQIFRLLKKDGIVQSERGVQGGYVLAHAPEEITIGQVTRALEDNLEIVDCLSGNTCCAGFCPTHNVWKRLYDGINGILDSLTLADMVKDFEAQSQFHDKEKKG